MSISGSSSTSSGLPVTTSRREIHGAGFGEITHGHALDRERHADLAGDSFGVFIEAANGAAPDDAESQEADIDAIFRHNRCV